MSAASRFGFYFYPRPPRGGRPGQHGGAVRDHDISIHALREEGDRRRSPAGWWAGYFYPRPPRGGRQLVFVELGGVFPFLSTPSARRATEHMGRTEGNGQISIHALREEGDVQTAKSSSSTRRFLSTPSARRATCPPPPHNRLLSLFLSTPSARRATYLGGGRQPRPADFYPRPPRGGRRVSMVMLLSPSQFLSTPSARRATSEPGTMQTSMSNFYPRPPRGGRPAQC